MRALADVARERGRYGMWVDNEAAKATYRRACANEEALAPFVLLNWYQTVGDQPS